MTRETVLVGGFSHETNTFATTRTDRELFREYREYFGADVPAKLRGTNTQIGGTIEAANALDVELRYTVAASAVPGGIVTEAAYEFYSEKILAGVQEHDVDGVKLALHGAMVSEGVDDGEGRLIQRVREVVGADVPIAVSLDLHGNISDRMVETADILVGFESYPHVDMGETGQTAMRLLVDTIRTGLDPVIHIERPPTLALGPKQNTREGPMAEVMATARRYEDHDSVLKVNVFPGFHQADVPSMGWSIPVVTDDDPETARQVAREMARHIWDHREDFIGEYPEPPEAISEAKQLAKTKSEDDGFVLLADVGDNPGGGGAGDGTTVLREMIDQGLDNAGFAIIRDPEIVEACIGAGVGNRTTVDLGGKTDDLHGDPIEALAVYVKTITDGVFVNTGPMATGSENNLGRGVLIQCGDNDGVSVIVTENRMQPLDAEIWRHVGIQPERLDVLVVKSSNHYRADYEPMCSTNIPIDSIGLVSMNPKKFEFTRIPRPVYPLDTMNDDAYPDW